MPRRAIPILAATAALASVLSGGAVCAQGAAKDGPKTAAFSKRLFAADVSTQNKSYACFVRVYDAVHLAGHRLQKVGAMKLLVTAETVPEDTVLNYSFRLGVKFRNRAGDFDSSGDCGHAALLEDAGAKPHLGCGVDCDGGGISIEMGKDDGSTLVRLERIRIWKNNKPEDEGLDLSGGADDRVFRLDRTSLEQCRSLVQDRAELAAMRRK